MTSKRCTVCLTWKPIDQFHKHADYKSGYMPRCKDCYNGQQRSSRAEKAKGREHKKPGPKPTTKWTSQRVHRAAEISNARHFHWSEELGRWLYGNLGKFKGDVHPRKIIGAAS